MTDSRQLMDRQAADLLERLARIASLPEACSVVLDRIVIECGLERAAVVVRSARPRGVAWGLLKSEFDEILAAVSERESTLAALLAGESLDPATDVELAGFDAAALIPVPGLDDRPFGAVCVEMAAGAASLEFIAELVRRSGASLARSEQLEALDTEGERLGRQRDLLTGIINALPDPVLLTDSENDILLANRRAEQLFSVSPDDSEGRRRAIQINNLLFSSMLTQAVIGADSPAVRELNLVDPVDGSDLHFESLSAVLPESLSAEGSAISILRDITDLKRAVTELEVQFNRSRVAEHGARRERDRLNAILENVGDPIVVTDPQANIILMNREAERLFEVPECGPEEVAGRRRVWANDTKFTSLVSDFLLQAAQRRIEKLDLTDPETGEDLPVEVISSKILNARGEATAVVAVLHDLTQVVENERLASELQRLNDDLENRIRQATVELEERNRRLEWQSRELEQASRLKSEFLANMSHELRTPINVVLGYTSLMRERIYGELTEQQETALQKVYQSSQHLLDLISDILDLSKIEAGKMPVHREEVSLPGLLRELSDIVEPLIREKALDHSVRIQDDLPVLVTDRMKLKQVLLNLVSNAIKFTREGSVRIEAAPVGDDRIRIAVADTGIGIRPEHLPTIFDDFRQVDQSPTREYPGTGLGLSITRKLTTLLGGTITVESVYGGGSRFAIELPVRAEGRVDVSVPAPVTTRVAADPA